tara:strand:- start:85 stop:447 length:363 start_codon:yes stop_codon:yes gene_type:complete
MNFFQLHEALEALGYTDDKYVLRLKTDTITDSESFIEAYSVVTGIENDHVVTSSDKSLIPVTWDQVLSKHNELKTKTEYIEKRLQEYPPIGDQLDKIYHSGINAWKADIKKIKDKYPKPS